MKRPIILVLLTLAAATVAVLLASAIITARMTVEVQGVFQMQALAAITADRLEAQFRSRGRYPGQLSDLQFGDETLFGALGVKRSDLQRFRYSSDRNTFNLRFESLHYRFGFSSDGATGLKAEPLTRKN